MWSSVLRHMGFAALFLGAGLSQAAVSLPNGVYSDSVTDLQVKVQGGPIRISRDYVDGHWELNNRWNSLKFEYDDLDGSVKVIDRSGGKYEKIGDTWTLDTRYVIRQSTVSVLPAAPDSLPVAGKPGAGGQLLGSVQGYRWQNRTGDWVEYDKEGRISSYGDRNDNRVWFQYDSSKQLRYLLDHQGRVAMVYRWQSGQVSQICDNPGLIAGNLDAARCVGYSWNGTTNTTPAWPLLVKATDANGNATSYSYENGLIKTITDAENRVQTFSYLGERVVKLVEPDGATTQYSYDYDKVKRQFYIKQTHPQTEAGKAIEEYWYDSEGFLIRRDLNGQTQSTRVVDNSSRTRTRKDAAGHATITTLDEYDNPIKVQYADGSLTTARYSAAHGQIVEETDELGVKTSYDYDGKGNLLKKTEAVGLPEQRVTEYQNDANGLPKQITRKGRTESNGSITPDATWQIAYDELGQIRETIDPEGKARSYVFARAGNLVKVTDALGHSTSYEVDAAGRLTKVANALGHSRRYEYDKVGNLTSETDSRGKATLMVYDAMNRRTQTIDALGGIDKVSYDTIGLVTKTEDADGRVMRFAFNNFQQLAKQTDALGNETIYDYQIADGSGGRVPGSLYTPAEIQYPSFKQKNHFDVRGRITQQNLINPSADGTQTTTSEFARNYDKAGRLISEADPYGKMRSYHYDALGQLVEATDTLNGNTQALYDSRGNLIALTDAKGNTTKFEYDRNNRLVKETLPLGQTTRYEYDDAGNLKQRLDPLGNKHTYSFDVANRLVEMKQYRAGNGSLSLVRTTTYTWGENDQLTAWSDLDATRPTGQQTASAQLTYDDVGHKISETVSYPNPQDSNTSLAYGYGYSAAGKKTQLTWADGAEIGYGYAAHGELESVSIPGEGTISVNQFKWTAPAQTTLPGGSTRSTSYDGLLQPESIQVKAPSQQAVMSLKHTWGKAFELQRSQLSQAIAGSTRSLDSSYTYDDELRLTQVKTDAGSIFGTDTESFTLDAVANRTAHSEVSGDLTYDANNRLKQRGNAASYQYDDNGNLILKTEGNKVARYAYDTLNRLTEVWDASEANSAQKLIARYGYDPMSRRIWKEQYRDKDANLLTQAKRTLYLYADEGLIAEATQAITLNSADNRVTASSTDAPAIMTQYGPKPNSPFTTGVLFVKTKNSNGQDTVAYYQHNHLSTPVQAIDKTGRVVWAAEYNAFGEATIITPAATTEDPTINSNLRLPGQYLDEETGLHYNWHRYYDPNIGRYITRDPIGLKGGLNFYSYVTGLPIGYIDPQGLAATGAAIGAAIGGVLGGAVGGVVGAGAGGAAGTVVVPGVGTIGGGAAGAIEGGALGASAGIVAGAIVGSTIEDFISAMSNLYEKAKKSREEQALNKEKNRVCKSPDPVTGDPCEDAKAKLNRLQQCLNLRVKYRDTYGDPDNRHGPEIENTRVAVERAKEAVKDACQGCGS